MAKKKKKNKQSLARSFVTVLNGNFLTRENALERLPYLFFFAFLIMLYIGNNHYAEKTIRETDKLSRELKELRSEYITTKFELMFKSRQSEIAKTVAELGLKQSITPPRKIQVNNE